MVPMVMTRETVEDEQVVPRSAAAGVLWDIARRPFSGRKMKISTRRCAAEPIPDAGRLPAAAAMMR